MLQVNIIISPLYIAKALLSYIRILLDKADVTNGDLYPFLPYE